MTVVAIDGPAGAGKSTIARAVARALGWRHVDTGALYRAIALAAVRAEVDLADPEAVARVAARAAVALDGDRVVLDGDDVTNAIREPRVGEAASVVAAHGEVRATLLERQREEARRGDVVMEGRDIGTTVVPDAEVKVYLVASLDERARRRAAQLGGPQDDATLARMAADIARRDEADASRRTSPLARSAGAAILDSTGRSVESIVAEIVEAVRGGD